MSHRTLTRQITRSLGVFQDTMREVRLCVSLICFTLLLALGDSDSTKQSGKKLPNIILVSVEGLGYNDVSYHGSEILTPNIDELAFSGIRLENYYIGITNFLTQTQLLTGQYAFRVARKDECMRDQCLSTNVNMSLVELVKENGYTTHMIGEWLLGYHNKSYLPLARGFDSFRGVVTHAEDLFQHVDSEGNLVMYNEWEKFNNTFGQYSTSLFSRRAANIIRYQAKQGDPLFMWLSYQAPGRPVQTPGSSVKSMKYIEDRKRRRFAGMIKEADDGIGLLIDTLKLTDMWSNTYVILTSTSGGDQTAGASSYPYRGDQGTLYQAGLKGIGILTGPLVTRPGAISNEMFHVTDWTSTIGSLISKHGGDKWCNSKAHEDGVDQFEVLEYNKKTQRQTLLHHLELSPEIDLNYTEFNTSIRAALTHNGWKIITGETGFDGWVPAPYHNYPIYRDAAVNRQTHEDKPTQMFYVCWDKLEKFPVLNPTGSLSALREALLKKLQEFVVQSFGDKI